MVVRNSMSLSFSFEIKFDLFNVWYMGLRSSFKSVLLTSQKKKNKHQGFDAVRLSRSSFVSSNSQNSPTLVRINFSTKFCT